MSILNVALNQCDFSPTFTQTTSHRFDLSKYATDEYVTESARHLSDVYPKSTESVTNLVWSLRKFTILPMDAKAVLFTFPCSSTNRPTNHAWNRETCPITATAAAAKSLQSCPTLCDHIDGSPSGSPIHGTLQARTLECSFPSPMHESEKWKWSHSVVPNGSVYLQTSQVMLVVKNPPANAGDIRDTGCIPGSGRPPGGEHGNPLQYSCLENAHGKRSLEGYSP